MKFALISTIEQPLIIWVDSIGEMLDPGFIAGHMANITAIPGTIINIIVYDGVTEYIPPDELRLLQVPDTAKIGDTGY